MKASITPLLHLNGSGAANLKSVYLEASRALTRALEEMGQAEPHGRDYYPLGEAVHAQALAEHTDRVRRVREVRDEIASIHLNLCDQTHAQKAQKSR